MSRYTNNSKPQFSVNKLYKLSENLSYSNDRKLLFMLILLHKSQFYVRIWKITEPIRNSIYYNKHTVSHHIAS